ncbi:MAG TPA: DUF1592 domain-containing protein [Steroidobacteraceae bacterium]|nr:DUF1592 domain-containing protein [Steroidobacteraceae bacterium]
MRGAVAVFLAALVLPAAAWCAPELQAVTGRYCTGCHNAEDWAGGLDLTSLDHGHVPANAAEWEKVVLKLRAGMMPPPGKERPTLKDTQAVVRLLETQLDAKAATHAAAPALHRLNRSEYANALRDMLGLKVNVADLLPPDDASEGFDNVASGLGISPALIQGYTTAAMKLSRLAVGDLTATESTALYQAPETLAQDQHLEGMPLGSRGGLRIAHYFPLDAEYHFSVRGGFALARNPSMQVDIALDGERIQVPNLRDFRLPVKAGEHVLTAAIFDLRRPAGVNDIYSVYRVEGAIDSVEIGGPFNATGPGDTESRRRIFSCHPHVASEEHDCAQRIVVDIASRAFRGPQKPADLTTIMQFYERGRAEGGFEVGIQQALSRILVDPRFLFRFEAEPAGAVAGVPYDISDLELASRLSFFLWSSIPDQALKDVAVAGQLHRPEVLAAQVRRMLADPRAQALVENFAGQWLFLRELGTVTPEVAGFDENLREGFIEETRSLVSWVLSQDLPVTELLTADYTFLNERLARHYGIPGVRGSHFRKVQLPPQTHRHGVLGQGSILTITSTATRTSPVLRGAWILGNILGAPPPAPPPGVETNIDGDGSQVITTSVRQRLELHRRNPSCAACHDVIDPVGFALENFDAIGAWRERDGDSRVDARGTLVDGTNINGSDDLMKVLMARSDLFMINFTQKLMTYALGRALDYRDMPAVRSVVQQAGRENYRISTLIQAVVQSPAFRQRQVAASQVRVAAQQGRE